MIGLVIMAACIVFFYKAGQMEGRSGFVWAGMSFVVWALTPKVLGYDLIWRIVGQVGLFIGIAVVRALWDEFKKHRGA